MLGGLRRGKAAPHIVKKREVGMMPIWRVQAGAITALVMALAIPAIAGIAVEFNQDVPSWLTRPVTGVVSLMTIGAALAVLVVTILISDKGD